MRQERERERERERGGGGRGREGKKVHNFFNVFFFYIIPLSCKSTKTFDQNYHKICQKTFQHNMNNSTYPIQHVCHVLFSVTHKKTHLHGFENKYKYL